MTQSDWIAEAEARRDSGIARAAAHAESIEDGWIASAYRVLSEFILLKRGEAFLSEDFVRYAEGRITAPPDPRTWGKPIQEAARKHLITSVGFKRANSSNRSPKTLWQEAV